MKTARELMTENPLCYSMNQSISRLFEMFVEHRISLVPIVDINKKPIGLIEDSNLYKILILHHYSDGIDKNSDSLKNYRKFIQEPSTLDESASIEEVIKALGTAKSGRLFIVEPLGGTLVGIISPIDVINFLAGEEKHIRKMQEGTEDVKKQIGQLEGRMDQLQDALNVYQNLFDNSPYMMHSVDAEGNLMMANQTMHRILKYNPGELIGKNIRDIYPESQLSMAREGLETIKKMGRFNKTYTSMVTKDKWLVTVDIASTSIQNEKGEFVATITSCRPLGASELQEALYSQIKD